MSSSSSNGAGNGKMLSDTIDRMISGQADFIPSNEWMGDRPGYYFGTTSPNGTGYHLDVTPSGNRKRDREDTKEEVRTAKKTGEQLLQEAEESISLSKKAPLTLDINTLEASVLSLERAFTKNQLQRAQYPNEPQRFMESELALHDEITNLKPLATDLSLYSHLVSLGTVETTLLELLSHDNVDMAMSVVSLFVELLDPALISDSHEHHVLDRQNMGLLACAVVGLPSSSRQNSVHNNDVIGLEGITANLARLHEEEDEEAQGVDDVLSLVENLLDLDNLGVIRDGGAHIHPSTIDRHDAGRAQGKEHPSIASKILRHTTLASWLLNRISQKDTAMTIKLHASEVLATILQHDDAQHYFNHDGDLTRMPPYLSSFEDYDDTTTSKTVDGMEIILQSIATYRKKDPESEEECEVLENIFLALAASLLSSFNVNAFVEAQGVELMIRCVKEKVHAGGGAVKVLSYALSGTDDDESENDKSRTMKTMTTCGSSYKRACETFVDAGGLKAIFPVFMGRGSSIPKPAKCSDAGGSSQLSKRQKTNGSLSKRAKMALTAKKEWAQNLESFAIQIVYALTRYLDNDSPYDAKARLLAKFVEADFEKCRRLVDLCLKYDEKMRLAEYRYYRSDEAEEIENSGVIDVDLAAMNAKLLKGGGDLFHRLGAIAAFVSVGSKRCHEHILEQFSVKNSGIGVVKAAIEDFCNALGEGHCRDQLQSYLSAI